jgi:ribosome-associated toxin RatA of RatAB toxin-antitoxin module
VKDEGGEGELNHQAKVSLGLAVSAENVFAALTDYSRYKDWVPGTKKSHVLVREGDIVVVEFEAPRFATKPVTFEFVHNAPAQIIYQQVGQYREHGLFGEWNITIGSTENEVQLQGRAEIRAPFYMFWIKKRLERALNESLNAFQAHIGIRTSEPHAETTGERVKILEVRQRRNSVEVWYQGRTYSCPNERFAIKT